MGKYRSIFRCLPKFFRNSPSCSLEVWCLYREHFYQLALFKNHQCFPLGLDGLIFTLRVDQRVSANESEHFGPIFFILSEGLSPLLGGWPWCTVLSNLLQTASPSQSSHTERNLRCSAWTQGCQERKRTCLTTFPVKFLTFIQTLFTKKL